MFDYFEDNKNELQIGYSLFSIITKILLKIQVDESRSVL